MKKLTEEEMIAAIKKLNPKIGGDIAKLLKRIRVLDIKIARKKK